MRQTADLKRSLVIMVALLLLGLLPAWALYGQEQTSTWARFPQQAQPIATSTPAAAPRQVVPAAITGPFLPIILTSSRVTPIIFIAAVATSCVGTAGTSFSYGIKYLCVKVTVNGAQGLAYRYSWTVNGQLQPSLGASGTISSAQENVPDGICYGPNGLSCGEAIPRGTYEVSFFLNNIQAQTATTVIQ